MFERLAAAGGAVRLQTQYRCHPAIAGAASSLFYGGAVSSGIPAAARPPLCALPAIAVYDTSAAAVRAAAAASPHGSLPTRGGADGGCDDTVEALCVAGGAPARPFPRDGAVTVQEAGRDSLSKERWALLRPLSPAAPRPLRAAF